ncbi:MAG: hypothetical protein JRF72_22670 [Deltaproteobacteria bacterium]|jgi:hypothetical protein|nr:hypothetical protein [Deltaproteobacteria bacterium]
MRFSDGRWHCAGEHVKQRLDPGLLLSPIQDRLFSRFSRISATDSDQRQTNPAGVVHPLGTPSPGCVKSEHVAPASPTQKPPH